METYIGEMTDEPEFPQMRIDHVGPIEGLNFMSLNMTDEQLDVILRAILRVGGEAPEASLATICTEYLEANNAPAVRPSVP